MPSNEFPLYVYDVAPVSYSGIRLVATDLAGNVLSSNIPYESLAFTCELSDVGAGKVELDFNAPYWKDDVTTDLTPYYVANREFFWQAWEGNKLRATWLNTVDKDTLVDSESLSRKVSQAGPGIGHVLTWSAVLPPKFPTVPPYYWSFAQARLWQWLTIWAECQLRTPVGSAQRRITPLFTRYTDAAGTAWKDPGFERQQENGVNMYQLLEEHCSATGCDFYVRPDFKIDVRYSRAVETTPGKFFGRDLTQVIFPANASILKQVDHDRSDIGNFVVAQDDYGDVTLKYNTASMTTHGHRERYVQAGRAGTASSRSSAAQEELKWHQDAVVSWTLQVPHYLEASDGTIFNRAFVDYTVGDWIYVTTENSSGYISLQVKAITMSVDQDGMIDVELTLESLASLRRRKAQAALNGGSGSSGMGGSGSILFNEEIFHVTSPTASFTLKYLPLEKSEVVTLGMKKYMETDGAGALAIREFTRTLERGKKWTRTGWDVQIIDTSVYDESF